MSIRANGEFLDAWLYAAGGILRGRKERDVGAITNHTDLIVWRKAVALAGKVYAATRRLPSQERFALGLQLRRAAVSIPSNIAEGAARRSRTELLQFLHVARGSLSEIETQTMIALELGFIAPSESPLKDVAEVRQLLNDLIRSLSVSKQAAHARACAPPQQPRSANR